MHAAAAAGLLPGELQFEDAGCTRAVLKQFIPVGFSIRLATQDDVPELMALESYWRSRALEADEATLRRRITNHSGQYVAAAPDGRLLGVMYTQRVGSYGDLLTAERESELDLHVKGGPVVQLLGVLSVPNAQVADPLRKFVLLQGRLDATAQLACGITRCRNYEESCGDYESYVKAGSDPGLLFHSIAGAEIRDLVPSYRPGDISNLGHGVIACYSLRSATSGVASVANRGAAAEEGADSGTRSPLDFESLIFDTIKALGEKLGLSCGSIERGPEALSTSFMDLGLDSLDLVQLVQDLNAKLQPALTLGRTIIYEHPNIKNLATFVHESLRAEPRQDLPLREPANAIQRRAISGLGRPRWMVR